MNHLLWVMHVVPTLAGGALLYAFKPARRMAQFTWELDT
jgi:hypothetical protein